MSNSVSWAPNHARPRKKSQCSICHSTLHTKARCINNVNRRINASAPKRVSKRQLEEAANSAGDNAIGSGANDSDDELTAQMDEMEVRDTGGQEDMVNMEETDQNDPDADASASVNIVEHIPVLLKPNASTRDLRSGTTVTIEENDGLPDFTPDNDQIPGPRVDNVATKSVLQFFLLFWTYMIIDKFSENTNAFASATEDTRWRPTSRSELCRFFGIVLYLGLLKVPERRNLWDPKTTYFSRFVFQTMTRHRFEAILRNLHWTNTACFTKKEIKEKNVVDCFWRMADFLDILAASFQKLYRVYQHVNVDEGGIPCKAYHSAIQYNADKPYKWFFKVYMLNCAKTKFLSNFMLSRGRHTDRPIDTPASAWPVIYLLNRPQYKNMNLICYLDNYFNGLKLVLFLMLCSQCLDFV
jgi:hypothetical protein